MRHAKRCGSIIHGFKKGGGINSFNFLFSTRGEKRPRNLLPILGGEKTGHTITSLLGDERGGEKREKGE